MGRKKHEKSWVNSWVKVLFSWENVGNFRDTKSKNKNPRNNEISRVSMIKWRVPVVGLEKTNIHPINVEFMGFLFFCG